MPLSEYEQRVLEQMERALSSDDPRLANTLQQTRRRSPLRYVLAGLGVVAGLLLLVVGVASEIAWVGVVGFALMFVGVLYALARPRKQGPAGVVRDDGTVGPNVVPSARAGVKGNGSAQPRPAAKSEGFLARLEERWERRRDQGR